MLAGALGVAPLLSGCVAAAIPVLAAGGVFQSQRHDSVAERTGAGQPRVSVDISPAAPAGAQPGTLVRSTTLADGTRMEVMAGPLDTVAAAAAEPAVAELDPAPANPVPPADEGPAGEAPNGYIRDSGGGLPPPAARGDGAGYDALYDFADKQAHIPVAGSERYSAILAQPLDLRPEMKECSIHPAAVLIDLDPAGGTLDPAVTEHADPELAAKLGLLRAQGVVIGWISANSADRAGELRRALVASGLDPAGRDELALLRYPEERKQTRREDFGKEFCLVAIAGDDRSDFDELYQYIKDPTLAAPLDALLGNGWFLIPQPLT
jgi:hypothetical protein